MAQFNPDDFVGVGVDRLESFFQAADQDALAAAWHGKVDWREPPTVAGAFHHDPTDVESRYVFPDDIGTDLPADHPPISVPNVEIIKYIGGGQSGWVYAGKVETTGLVVAVKVLRNDRDTDTPRTAANEAIIGAKLQHRNIMGIFDLRPVQKYWIILMELVKGDSLSEADIQGEEARSVFGCLSDAIHHMGVVNVVHRDLKPDNIVLRRSDRSPVIVDLGLSVDMNVFDPNKAGIAGTPLFMPPEAFDGVITTAFDAYSLGVTAAKVIAGDLPHLSGGIPKLFENKKSGLFREQLVAMLDRADVNIKEWISRITDSDLNQRIEALNEARTWMGL